MCITRDTGEMKDWNSREICAVTVVGDDMTLGAAQRRRDSALIADGLATSVGHAGNRDKTGDRMRSLGVRMGTIKLHFRKRE